MAGVLADSGVHLDPVHRFPNGATMRDGHLRWDIVRLFDEVCEGLSQLADRYPQVESIGIDTWAIDYALLDRHGGLLADPIAYRDDRTDVAVPRVHALVDEAALYEINGLQFLPFNTLYQLEVERHGPHWADVAHVALLPDLLAYWLSGELRTEATNASTTGLVDVHTGDWSVELLDRLGLDPGRFPPLEPPGARRGTLRPEVAARLGLSPSIGVTTVGSHDTASAVVGVPAVTDRFAFIASGTWSLVGLELEKPVLTTESRIASFSNEAGVDGTTRFLRNVGGLWLLQECQRTWADEGTAHDLTALLGAAAELPAGGPTIDVNDTTFIPPGEMPRRIAGAVAARGDRLPPGPPATVRCILDSLASAYARTVDQASALAGVEVEVVHVVGGGAQNDLLGQLTADATGRTVVAGPVEATALGNVLVQARALGAAPVSLGELRTQLARTTELRTFKAA